MNADNPVFWIIMLTSVCTVAGIIFAAGRWKGEIDSERKRLESTLNAFMAEIRADIKKIFLRLPSSTLSEESPLQLTELGRGISERLEAPRWASETAEKVRPRTKGMVPYDIQEFCRLYVRDDYEPSQEMEESIKACAYEHGLDRQQVLDVLAIALRDRLIGGNG